MIYIVCATQVFTVFCVLVCVRWSLAYLSDRDKLEQRNFERNTEVFQELKKESDEALWTLINQFHQERELLIERAQHPQTTQGQAAAVGGDVGSTIVDEEVEAKEEFGHDDDAPTQVIGPVGPIRPIRAIGADDA